MCLQANGHSLIGMLLSRRSVSALVEPAPSDPELDLILDAGLRAPDHGRLRPWRFVLIRGEARQAFGERLAEAVKVRDRRAAPGLVERSRTWPMQYPLLVAVGAVVRPGHPVPESEQLMSAAAAAMNMLNAIHILGYGGIWVTGPNVYDAGVNAALGLAAPSRMVGLLAVGTPRTTTPAPERPLRTAHVMDWVPPAS